MVTVEELKEYEKRKKLESVKRDDLVEIRLEKCKETLILWQKAKKFDKLIDLYRTLDKMKFKTPEVDALMKKYTVDDKSNKMGFCCNENANWFKDTYYVALENTNENVHDVMMNDDSIIVEIGDQIMARSMKTLNIYHIRVLERFIAEFPKFEQTFISDLENLIKQ